MTNKSNIFATKDKGNGAGALMFTNEYDSYIFFDRPISCFHMAFGVTSLRNLRKFYEAWSELEDNSASALAELQNADVEPVEFRQVQLPNSIGFPLAECFFYLGVSPFGSRL
ncbi:MAG: hypothetical protein IKS22_11600 [Bacteroidales bacterium]|nr:hypothetical protein [Bacteroidales bacterium]